jgi:hypothetical protein
MISRVLVTQTKATVVTCSQNLTQSGICKSKIYLFSLSFNVAKRVQKNDLEHLVVMAPGSLLNGLFMPYPTLGILAIYFLGRQLYSTGYFEKEGANNKKRMAGSLLCNLSHMSTLGITIFLGYKLSRGKLRF